MTADFDYLQVNHYSYSAVRCQRKRNNIHPKTAKNKATESQHYCTVMESTQLDMFHLSQPTGTT